MAGSTSYCAANGPATADYLLMSGATSSAMRRTNRFGERSVLVGLRLGDRFGWRT